MGTLSGASVVHRATQHTALHCTALHTDNTHTLMLFVTRSKMGNTTSLD